MVRESDRRKIFVHAISLSTYEESRDLSRLSLDACSPRLLFLLFLVLAVVKRDFVEILFGIDVETEVPRLQEVALSIGVLLRCPNAHAGDDFEAVELVYRRLEELLVLAVRQVVVFEDFVELAVRHQAKNLVERTAVGNELLFGLFVLAERKPVRELDAAMLALEDPDRYLNLPTETAVNQLRVRKPSAYPFIFRDNVALP